MSQYYKSKYTGTEIDNTLDKINGLVDLGVYSVNGMTGAVTGLANSNPNLLINPNFAINQRGQSVYNNTNAPTNNYTVDRWIHYANNAYTLTPITGGGATIVNSGASSVDFANIIENGRYIIGSKTVTISISVSNSIYYKSFSLASAGTSNSIGVTGEWTLYLEWTSGNVYKAWLRVYAGKTVTINWVKVELGSVATAFVPPMTAEELTKCQRCGFPIESLRFRVRSCGYIPNSYIDFWINAPVSLRTSPTIATNGFTVATLDSVEQSGFTFTIPIYASNGFMIRATKTNHGLTDAQLRTTSATFIDAEIY